MNEDRRFTIAQHRSMNITAGTAVTVEIVAAFVDERNGGNLAGVVLDRPDLSEAQMQAVAAFLGFSETAFMTEMSDGFRFDVFTPQMRVPDCGHATVAAFGVLAQHGRFAEQTIKHTIVGPRAIALDADGRVFMQQPASRFETGPQGFRVAASLGLSETTAFAADPAIARHDVAFLIVPLPVRGMLDALVPNPRAIEAISETIDVLGYYVFAPAERAGFDATTRMFAPRAGIAEESATGMAAGMLAAFLHDRGGATTRSLCFEQGAFMQPPSPSRLEARLELNGERIREVWVGGFARVRETRTVTLPVLAGDA